MLSCANNDEKTKNFTLLCGSKSGNPLYWVRDLESKFDVDILKGLRRKDTKMKKSKRALEESEDEEVSEEESEEEILFRKSRQLKQQERRLLMLAVTQSNDAALKRELKAKKRKLKKNKLLASSLANKVKMVEKTKDASKNPKKAREAKLSAMAIIATAEENSRASSL